MSITLPISDLSGATVGSTGTIDWSRITGQSSHPAFYGPNTVRGATGSAAHLQLFNESGCGLEVQFPSGDGVFVPAGGWLPWELDPSATSLTYTVIYQIPNAPVSQLIAVYYFPHETPPNIPILGNSPVGIGGTVSTSTSNIYYNVKDNPYNAKGDGVTDDTTAIQAAIAAAIAAGGGVVYFPTGVYIVSAALVIQTGVTLLGEGEPAGNVNSPRLAPSIIKGAAGMTDDIIRTPLPPVVGNAGFVQYGCAVRDLGIDCSAMAGTVAGKGNGIHFYGVRYGNIEHTDVFSSKNYGIVLEGDGTNFAYNTTLIDCNINNCNAGVLLRSSEQCTLNRVIVHGATAACTANQPYSNPVATTAYQFWVDVGWTFLTNCSCGTSGNYTNPCIFCTNGEATLIIGCLFDQPHGIAVQSNGGRVVVANCTIQNPNTTTVGPSIQLGGSGQNIVMGNVFTGAAGNMTYAVLESGTPADSVIIGNTLLTGSGGAVSLVGTSTARVYGNKGSDDVTPNNITAPTFKANGPASSAYFSALIPSTVADQNGILDWTDQTAGGVHWQVGKQSHANGDWWRVVDATHGVAVIALQPNGTLALFPGEIQANGGNRVLQIRSNGGGAAGVTLWVGTTDPAGNAGEGDIWLPI